MPISVGKHFGDLGLFIGGAGLVNFLAKASDRRESGNASALENNNAVAMHHVALIGIRCAFILLWASSS